jgi:6-phosphogluconolactonase
VLDLGQREDHPTLVQTMVVNGRVMPLAISPDRRYLYAALRSAPHAVWCGAIDPVHGTLRPVQTGPLVDSMAYLSIDRSGRYLFAASYGGSKISVNAIRPDSVVDPVPLAVVPTRKNAHAIATDPSNAFLFVSCLGDDVILQYRFDAATGQITPNEPSAVTTRKAAGPRHFVFHPTRAVVYGVNELDGSVNTYQIENTGVLTLLASQTVMPDGFRGIPWAADIHLTPNGRFLYTSERTSSTLAAFRIDSDSGALTPIDHYETEPQPRGFAIDPEGTRLLAVGEMSGCLSTYEIDQSTGALRPMSRLNVEEGPNWVEIIPLPVRGGHAQGEGRPRPDPRPA